MNKHTPGPWKVIPSPHGKKYRCVQYGTDDTYASLEMLPADARLTAAAPDLLQLLQEILPELQGWDDDPVDGKPWEVRARAAIAKATGTERA